MVDSAGLPGPAGANGQDGRDGTNGQKGDKGERGEPGIAGPPGPASGGATYTRWGNTCMSYHSVRNKPRLQWQSW